MVFCRMKPMMQGEHEAEDQHGERSDGLAPELVDPAAVEQAGRSS